MASRAELEARERRVRQPARYLACQWCGQPMPEGLRSHARYCKATCRVLASRSRRRAALGLESVNPTILGAALAAPADGRSAA